MALMSMRAYGRRIGVNHVTVQRAVKSGRISLVEGKIDPRLADQQWRRNTDPSTPRNRVTGHPKHSRVSGGPSEPMNLGGSDESHGGAGTGYARARAARELYQAQLAKLDLDSRRGLVVRADEVRLGAFSMARRARDQLMAIPDRICAALAATDDPEVVRRILDGEIERICQEIVDGDR
jgi:hypothetical protein